jgi:hypothetical protein
VEETQQTQNIRISGSFQARGSQSWQQPKSSTRNSSETPSLVQDKGLSPSPSTEGSISHPVYSTVPDTRRGILGIGKFSGTGKFLHDWSHLPQDLQFYLAYFCEKLTFHHYSIKHDSCDFLQTHLLDAALRNESLLHALVGFSAFQYTIHHPGGQINSFLQYYNKAVSLLLKSLKRGERHNIGILLAILQLATIEVCIRLSKLTSRLICIRNT